MRSSILCALLASVLASVSVMAAPLTAGNFSLSCTGVNLTRNHILNAACATRPHGSTGTSTSMSFQNKLDLALCIGIDSQSSRLQWDVYGKFTNYCHNCTMLAAAQEHNNHHEGIANDNGTLKCRGGMAVVTPAAADEPGDTDTDGGYGGYGGYGG
ncbi:hypothetical protein BT67DRAFT_437425 [Trichocladium antarcticum]|uniref:Cyanovirin-N domain-containing protein n=1 Tax=Trichocladium antarcticum TaxID=1450529 RepID=A0AAN6UC09_9PEZI|nr:hypothetical protein BT67DRAFT_437425 [Trichocladium antarcticum]